MIISSFLIISKACLIGQFHVMTISEFSISAGSVNFIHVRLSFGLNLDDSTDSISISAFFIQLSSVN